MAKVTPKGLSGVVGTVVAYTMKGEEFVRSRPKKNKKKKTEPLLPTRALFGSISRFGSAMLVHMSKEFRFPFGLKTYNGVRGWMRNYFILHGEGAPFSAPPLSCQLNGEADLRDHFPLPVAVRYEAGILSVTLPSFTPAHLIKAPATTTHVQIKLVAVSSDFTTQPPPHKPLSETLRFGYTNEPVAPSVVKLNMEGRTGHIALVAMALEFEVEGKMVTEKEWLPAAAIALGRFVGENTNKGIEG